MSNNRKLVSDIRELDQGITECENFLAKVLNRKTENARQVPAIKKKNVSSKSVSRPQSRGPETARQRTPSVGANSTKGSTKSGHSVKKSAPAVPLSSFSQRVSPDRLTKPANSEIHRRRSNSVSRLASQACRCEPSKPVFTNKKPLHVHVPNVSRSKESRESDFAKPDVPSGARSRSPDLRNKDLSWGEILRANHPICHKPERGHWDIGGYHHPCSRSVPPTHPYFTTKLPHECESIKDCGSLSSELTAGAPCNHFFNVSVARRPQEESFSSEGTSGFSSNNDLPSNMINRSVQCGSPIPSAKPKSVYTQQFDHRRVSSTSSGASSQKEEKEKVGVLGSDVFMMFNPVRTLNFLVKELQGMVQKHPKEDGSVCRIIADMEKVLHRLPESGEFAESTSGYTTRSKPPDSHSVTSTSTRSYNTAEKPIEAEAQKAAALKALQAVPALAKRIDERIESMRSKILEAKTHIPVPSFTPMPPETYSDSVDNVFHLQRYVEKSGHQLEIMCQTMEKTCDALRNERNALQGDLDERDKKLRIVKSQEQDFVTTVTSLRTNLETTTRRVSQLSVENKILKEQVKELPALKYIEEKYKELTVESTKLKEENKIIPALRENEAKMAELKSELACLEVEKKNLKETIARNNEEIKKLKGEIQNPLAVMEATKRLTQRLQDTMKERDDAQHDLQMLRIEREKLLVLSETKNLELSNIVNDILNIKKMVTEELDILKTNIPRIIPECMSDVMNSSMDSDEMNFEVSHHPICSSPTSTASAAPRIDDVWQDISTIIPEQTRSSPEILISTNSRKMEETVSPPTDFQSLARDTWRSVPTTALGDPQVSEDDTPRPRTAVPGSRPPVHQNSAVQGDNQWCGAAAVTQELQHNVEELFRLIKTSSKLASSSSEVVPSPLPSAPSSRHPTRSGRFAATRNRNIQFQMPKLPEPPKFLETPEFSDFSSYHDSLGDTSSVESIDAVLKELQKDNAKQKLN